MPDLVSSPCLLIISSPRGLLCSHSIYSYPCYRCAGVRVSYLRTPSQCGSRSRDLICKSMRSCRFWPGCSPALPCRPASVHSTTTDTIHTTYWSRPTTRFLVQCCTNEAYTTCETAEAEPMSESVFELYPFHTTGKLRNAKPWWGDGCSDGYASFADVSTTGLDPSHHSIGGGPIYTSSPHRHR